MYCGDWWWLVISCLLIIGGIELNPGPRKSRRSLTNQLSNKKKRQYMQLQRSSENATNNASEQSDIKSEKETVNVLHSHSSEALSNDSFTDSPHISPTSQLERKRKYSPVNTAPEQVYGREEKKVKTTDPIKTEPKTERESRARRRTYPIKKERKTSVECRISRRSDPIKKAVERKADRESTAIRRADPVKREEERKGSIECRKARRADPIKREAERKADRESKADRRADPVNRAVEQKLERESRAIRRADPAKRAEERKTSTEGRMIRRSDPVKRAVEQKADTESRAIQRTYSDNRAEQRKTSTDSRNKRRSDPVKRAVEQEADTESRAIRRADLLKAAEERKTNTEGRKITRSDPVKRAMEQKIERESRAIRRADPAKTAQERKTSTEGRKIRRLDPVKRGVEQKADTESRAIQRTYPDNKAEERKTSTDSRNKRRSDPVKRAVEQEADTESTAIRRADPLKAAEETKTNTEGRNITRSDPVKRALEQKIERESRAIRRADPAKTAQERKTNTEGRKIRRLDPVKRGVEQEADRESTVVRRADAEKCPIVSSRQPVKGPTVSSPQPVKGPTVSSPQPVKGPTVSLPQPVKGPTVFSPQPVKGPTVSSPQPVKGPTVSSPQPAKGPTVSSPRPAKGPTVSSPQPAKFPAVSSVFITHVTPPPNQQFLPVDISWQRRNCSLLNLPIHAAAFPSCRTATHTDIGTPDQLQAINSDGNCFFRSVSFALTGTELYHFEMRKHIVKHTLILDNKLQSILPPNTSARQYVKRKNMSRNKEWATDVEIFVAAHLLETNIYTYTKYGATDYTWQNHSPTFIDSLLVADQQAIYLQHTNENHYEVVLSTTHTSVPTVRVGAAPTSVSTVHVVAAPTSVPTVRVGAAPTSVSTVRVGAVPTSLSTVCIGAAPTSVPTVRVGAAPTSMSTVRVGAAPTSVSTVRFGAAPTSLSTVRVGAAPTSLSTLRIGAAPTSLSTLRVGAAPPSVPNIRIGAAPTSVSTLRVGAAPTSVLNLRVGAAPTSVSTFCSKFQRSANRDHIATTVDKSPQHTKPVDWLQKYLLDQLNRTQSNKTAQCNNLKDMNVKINNSSAINRLDVCKKEKNRLKQLFKNKLSKNKMEIIEKIQLCNKEINKLHKRLYRNDSKVRMVERTNDVIRKSIKRKDQQYRTAEKVKDSTNRHIHRQSESCRTSERTNDTTSRRIHRQSEPYRNTERVKEASNKREYRQSQPYRNAERVKEASNKREHRQSEPYRNAERAKGSTGRRIHRRSESYRNAERAKDTTSRRIHRQSQPYRNTERVKEASNKREHRQSESYRNAEIAKDTTSRRIHRQSQPYRNTERVKEASNKREHRRSESYRNAERAKDTTSRRIHRQSEIYRIEERGKDRTRRHIYREHYGFRKLEILKKLKTCNRQQMRNHKRFMRKCVKIRRKQCLYIRKKRKNEDYQEKEITRKRIRRENPTYRAIEQQRRHKVPSDTDMISQFHHTVNDGPVYICTCCNQLWYRHSVRLASGLKLSNSDLRRKCVTGMKSKNDKEWICNTCTSALKKGNMPSLAISNGIVFCEKPAVLHLSNLEERLVSPRIPFMQLHELPRGGQISLKGNIVNVPTNINTSTSVLPRKSNDNACIPIKLKRKLSYEQHYMFQTVRPNKVLDAVNYLVNSPLYISQGIVVDNQWKFDEDVSQDAVEEEGQEKKKCDDEEWDERTLDDMPAGNFDTLFQENDISEESRRIISVAPGEGAFPMSIFMDKNSEELSFPTIFCGKARPDNSQRCVNVFYSDICKSELRQTDRRAAGHIPNLFFKMKKLQMKQILDRASLCLRKTRKHSTDITAGMLKSPERVNTIVNVNEGFRVFRDLRGSPPYWERVKKDLFALLRQLSIPTWFASFSSAETRWSHVLQILGQTVDKKDYSLTEVQSFDWFQKTHLISKDPVTCARHFDFQFQKFLHTVLKSSTNPIGKVTDYFYKVEFQMRGSPHIHMLIWIDGAPNQDEETTEETIDFIDRYISCSKQEDISDLVDRQKHMHSRTCQKKTRKICRFNYPQPPMSRSCILEPLPDDFDKTEARKLKDQWKKIQAALDQLKDCQTLDVQTFLQSQSLTEDTYILAIRSSIRSRTVFLQRDLNEIRINNYNKLLLQAWRANMDLQFVLDPFACAMYIVQYIAKSQRGMSNLLYNACKEAQEGNADLRKQVQHIGNKFLNNVEVSAQEAVYYVLQIPLYKSSRDVIFVNTSQPEERTVMLKSFQQLQALPDDSTDIVQEGLIQHYASRPSQLEDTCLATFVSQYRRVKKSPAAAKEDRSSDVEENNMETDIDASHKSIPLKNGYVLQRRRQPAVIRYVHFHEDKDKELHYREILMLFHPWRQEDELKANCETFEERYQVVAKETVALTENMQNFNHHSKTLELAMKAMDSMDDSDLEDQWDQLAPNTQHIEHQDEDEGTKETDIYPSIQPHTADIGFDLGLQAKNTADVDVIIHMLPDAEYHQMAQSLNVEQRLFFYHVLHWMKTKPEPLYAFLTGGAGVGKTVVVKVIHQALLRYYNSGTDVNPDDPKVLLGAPTGKAAYLINGNTLHNLFAIPASQGFTYKPLAQDRLNTLRCKFQHVKLLIIDEVSMVGNHMFNFINQRLQQVMGSYQPFGGISVIAVGDLYQLKPVFDGWIFHNLTRDYGPLATNLWMDYFTCYQLTQIMRQKDDLQFAELLNRLRIGKHTVADVELLKGRLLKTTIFDPGYPTDLPHIFLKNALVESHNSTVFQLTQDSRKLVVHAVDVVVGDIHHDIKQKILKIVPTDCSKTMGLVSVLQTAVDLRIEISTNVDVEDGLANGASGVLKAVSLKPNAHRPYYIWVLFDDARIGKNMRRNSKHLYSSAYSPDWTPVAEVKRQFKVGNYKAAQVLRSQFPVRPACAKTAHRCQGDTMDSAVIDLGGRAFPHAHYVTLSRVRNLSNLHIKTLNSEGISVSKPVSQEMLRLEEERKLTVCFTPLSSIPSPLKIVFHNVRSLHKHFPDVSADSSYCPADIIIFTESRLTATDKTDDYNLPGFHLHRFDSTSHQHSKVSRSPYGIAVYTKYNVDTSNITQYRVINSSKTVVECVIITLQNVGDIETFGIVGLYASPKTTTAEMKTVIHEVILRLNSFVVTASVITGDFNIDLLKTPESYILKQLYPRKQFIDMETTDFHSLLDHVYSELPDHRLQTGVGESYFSDHKPVWMAVKTT